MHNDGQQYGAGSRQYPCIFDTKSHDVKNKNPSQRRILDFVLGGGRNSARFSTGFQYY